jgi:hypothetical protein
MLIWQPALTKRLSDFNASVDKAGGISSFNPKQREAYDIAMKGFADNQAYINRLDAAASAQLAQDGIDFLKIYALTAGVLAGGAGLYTAGATVAGGGSLSATGYALTVTGADVAQGSVRALYRGDLNLTTLGGNGITWGAEASGYNRFAGYTVDGERTYALANLGLVGKQVINYGARYLTARGAPTFAAEGAPEAIVYRSAHPESAQHILDAQAAGHPIELTIDRSGALSNRASALEGYAKIPGKHLDEYPPAMFKEGGAGASVRGISPSDNMGAGASIGNQIRRLPDGTVVRIIVKDGK